MLVKKIHFKVENNRFLMDPITKKVFYNQGNNIGELQPNWERKKTKLRIKK